MATELEALAQQLGGTVQTPVKIDITGGIPIFAESPKASTITPPAGFQLLSAKLTDAKPTGSYFDETLNAWLTPTGQATQVEKPTEDLAALAAQLGGTVAVPSTTATGLAGAATRGLAV